MLEQKKGVNTKMNKMLDMNSGNLLVFACSADAEQVMCRTYRFPTLKVGLKFEHRKSLAGESASKTIGDEMWI